MSWLLVTGLVAVVATVVVAGAVLRRRRRAPAVDPLVTLGLQLRLGEVARELRALQDDPDVYARAHHWVAAQGAYDALLREACRLTGLDVQGDPLRAGARERDDERLREELELSSRGWSW